METITIEGKELKGTFVAFPNNNGFNFILESGAKLRANFKQGYQGNSIIRLECQFDTKKKFRYSFPNSGRQVKDPNAYFISFE